MEPVQATPVLLDVVYQRLLAAIIDCTLLPGQRIRQYELADMLGVSRAPISHALQVLKHQGLLQEAGKKGLEIAPIDPQRVLDHYQVRAALDGLAARMAAERCQRGSMTKAEKDRLQTAFDFGMRLGDETAMSKRVEADIGFHRTIYAICGNAAITETLEPIWPHMQRAMVLVLEANPSRRQAWEEHARIMAHIFAGKPAQSSEAAFDHAANAGLHVAARLRQTQQEPEAAPRKLRGKIGLVG